IGGYETSLNRTGLELIYPLELAAEVVNEICREENPEEDEVHEVEYSIMSFLSYNMPWSTKVAVKRAIGEEFPDEELKRYAAARKIQYEDLMEMVYGGGYAENLRMLKVTEVCVWLLSVFIIIVCMIQIINTLQANMRLRRRELWLYDVVGMEPKQKFKMLLIEHGLSAIVAMVTGMIASFAFSYWMLEGMLDVNETQEFVWPVGKGLVIGGMILAVILAVNMLEIRRNRRDGSPA
ncbi:MAG: ABC transporter permease, partial [Lachnospiraceae bacterium]|nr:ABC transporter permease [Lachnospiraceae bacterium]